ncbi:MAG: right-handed parallel beta-helix repeat-containing protein [Candidatus Schekmanbacteria bacterium]|nr:right-handed parallel beta-helix repeat-containing protein [Candidatus Schekmanbacteria bacterium]
MHIARDAEAMQRAGVIIVMPAKVSSPWTPATPARRKPGPGVTKQGASRVPQGMVARLAAGSLALAVAATVLGGDLLLVPACAGAATYYVSAGGSDEADGITPGTAWKTIGRVNTGTYGPGDAILLEGGSTFAGPLLLSPDNNQATAAQPLQITSYGAGRATIASAAGDSGVVAAGVAAFALANVVLAGADAAGGGSGIMVLNETALSLAGIRVTGVEIYHHTYALYAATADPPSEIRDIVLSEVNAHDNAAGPSFFGHYLLPAAVSGDHYGIANVRVERSELWNNTGAGLMGGFGAGLVLMNARDAVIEYNHIHDNGGNNPELEPNGPCAITVYDGHNFLVQHNEVDHQRYALQNQTDNGGIDFWGTSSTIQHNFVHDNEGWGFTLGAGDPETGGAGANWPSHDNVVRFNVLLRNGQLLPDRPAEMVPHCFAAVLMFGAPKRFEIYNNTIFAPFVADVPIPEAVQGLFYLVDVPGLGDTWSDIHLRNNVLVVDGDVAFVEVPRPAGGTGLRIEGNAYLGGETRPVVWGETVYADVSAWASATGQETLDQALVATVAGVDALCQAGGAEAADHRLAAASPVVDAGLDLGTRFGLDVGQWDFFGNPVPSASGLFDPGAHEQRQGETCASPPTVGPGSGAVLASLLCCGSVIVVASGKGRALAVPATSRPRFYRRSGQRR